MLDTKVVFKGIKLPEQSFSMKSQSMNVIHTLCNEILAFHSAISKVIDYE